jgi:hypothetical protein
MVYVVNGILFQIVLIMRVLRFPSAGFNLNIMDKSTFRSPYPSQDVEGWNRANGKAQKRKGEKYETDQKASGGCYVYINLNISAVP